MSTGPDQISVADDKTAAIVSYLTIFGFVAAIFIHNGKKTPLGAFHLRQSLGLFLSGIALGVASAILGFIPFVGWLVSLALYLGFFVFWVMGLIAALNGQQKPVPVLGEHYQKWFATAF